MQDGISNEGHKSLFRQCELQSIQLEQTVCVSLFVFLFSEDGYDAREGTKTK